MQHWVRRAVLAGLGLLASGVLAQGLESVLRPGDVIAGHAKWEDDCSQCHVRFDRAAQDRLCMDCHKDVGQDVRDRTGYHGRLRRAEGQAGTCRSCHTDHRGRNARIVQLDTARFDHATTDYVLNGRHAKVDCAACHPAGRKYRAAPHDCNACHRKDDAHKGSLGPACADCHGEAGWKPARFDHGKTRFALTGKHAQARCESCHRDGKVQDTPRACLACHRDDDRRAHRGQFGERCESCHDARAWRPATFNHNTATRFPLRGRHRNAACADCHGVNPVGAAAGGAVFPGGREKPAGACIDCHRKDDTHRGSLGPDCGACHGERDWKERGRFDHDKTGFVLHGRHRDASCAACHKTANPKGTPRDCLSCHREQDKHQGTLGAACGDCHDERDWKRAPRFDHARTRFPLRHAHASPPLACRACHADARQLRNAPLACQSCHQKHDRHEGQLGARCESCHDDRSWKVAAFDHARTRFALTGGHAAVACKSCHTTPRYRDAARDCIGCHRKDDRHKASLGSACESCHNTRHWGLGQFDHARRTRFALDGAHTALACERCHTQPAPAGRAAAAVSGACVSCHRRDDVHDGAFGAACDACHFTERWKRLRPRVGRGDADGAARRP